MSETSTSNRGGARPGAGRKKNVEISDAYTAFNKARAKKEIHNAKMAEYEERRIAGELVEVSAVISEWQSIIATARAKLLIIPGKVAPMLYGVASVAEINKILTDEIYSVLTELANDDN